MITSECPKCDTILNLEECGETAIICCPECDMKLEIVSLNPPVLEEALENELEE